MWEYKVMKLLKLVDEKSLNVLGERGWELVAVMEFGDEHGPMFYFYFKRRRSSE